MKLAIIRTFYSSLNIKAYNIQEIGLAKGLLNFDISTDIYSRFKDMKTKTMLCQQNNCYVNLIPIEGKIFLNKFSYFQGLIKLILENDYDIVQVHEDSQFMTPFILRKCYKNGIKTVLYQGMYTNYKGIGHVYQRFFDFLFKRITQKNCNIILAKTPLAKQYLEKKGYRNVSILPIGLDYENEQKSCNYQKQLDDFKSQYDKVLLYIGKIEERRNPFFLIDVLSDLNKHHSLNIGLIVVGGGPLCKQMIDYAKKINIFSKIFILDSLPNNEIHAMYKASDLFYFQRIMKYMEW
jgi:glycosyltransferase involved in cell wall biosynthesis